MARDSLGIEIVENTADTASLPVWRPDSVPVLEIGAVSGNPPAEFGSVEAALQLSNGTLVVADGQAREIRFFRSDGTHLRTAGRAGGGPGEYEYIFSMQHAPGDSVVVWDTRARRATVYSLAGELARVISLEYPESFWADGSPGPSMSLRMVMPVERGWVTLARPSAAKPPDLSIPSIHAQPVMILSHDDDGMIRDTLATAAGDEILYLPGDLLVTEGFPVPPYTTIFRMGATKTHVAMREDAIVIGESHRFELRVHSPDGRLVRIIRHRSLERPYTDAEFETHRANSLDWLRGRPEAAVFEASMTAAYKPDRRPAFSDIALGADGSIWVEEWRGDADLPVRWIVYGPDGRARAVAEIPRDLRVTDRGADYIVAVRRDELDVEYVSIRLLVQSNE